jgi:sodium transport system permease protein
MSRIQTVFLKELRDLYRDRRTLMVTVVLPLLMYPIIFIGILQITMLQAGKLKEQVGRVALLTPERLPGDFLVSDSTGQLLELTDSIEWQDKLKVGELDAALSLSPGFSDSLAGGGGATITVHYLSSRDFSDQVRRRLEKVADDYQKRVVTSRLDLIGVETAFIHPVALEAVDEASQQEQAGSALGKFLGYLLILTTLSGAFYAAIDLTAGEKERGTLETLLVSPASRKELVYGKFYATLVAALVTAILNLLSMGFTMMYAVRMLDKNEVMGMAISVPSLLLVLLTLIPLAVLFAGATLALAVTARNYKEGQGLLSPMIMVSILPAMVSMVPGIELTPLLAVIPIANVSLLMRSLMSGNTPWLEMTITLVSTGALAMLALRWVTIQFNRESVLFRHAEDVKWSMFTKPVREVGKVLTPTAVALLSAVAVIVVGGAGSFASPEVPFSAILVVQAALAGLAAVWVYRGGYDPVPAFGWRKPALMSFPAVLIALMGDGY